MTWTFDPTNPTDRDRLRLLINDIDVDKQKFSDEILDMMLTEESSDLYESAIRLAMMLADRYNTKASVSLGPLSYSFSEQAGFYTELAEKLRARQNGKLLPLPYYNPSEESAKHPMFGIGANDNEETYPTGGAQ